MRNHSIIIRNVAGGSVTCHSFTPFSLSEPAPDLFASLYQLKTFTIVYGMCTEQLT